MPKNIVKKNKTSEYSTDTHIIVKGARVHNLKNIDLAIERDTFVVITGLSGSGKSSLAFDTLYAEGQRRYVESLSSYARQFLGRINKPDVDYIKGIPPAIAIEQKVNTRNPRSTVGTSTEIYDYLKLLYARVGKTISPVSGKIVKRSTVSDVVDYILSFDSGVKVMILAPLIVPPERTIIEHIDMLRKQGFSRIQVNKQVIKIHDFITYYDKRKSYKDICLVVDRLKVSDDEDTVSRMGDSVQTAFYEGKGKCKVEIIKDNEIIIEKFSNKFEADGITFREPEVNMFSFNNPIGACELCEGYGKIIGIDEDLVVPNKNLSVYEGAIACWKGEKMGQWLQKLINNAHKFNFPIHTPYKNLTEEQKKLLWTGNKYFYGLNEFFRMLEAENYKIQYRVMLARYRGKTTCPQCNGTRLKKDASYVKIGGKAITELVEMPISELKVFFDNLKLEKTDAEIAERILHEIKSRINFLCDVGLGYLTLNRLSSTLSGGESQRINLATSLGSSLVGSLYILDEPSIGLHPRDTNRLIKVLRKLTDLGNTVIVVEHDEEIIRAADQIIDIGPEAGVNGGRIVFQGRFSELQKSETLTARYLTGRLKIPLPKTRRIFNKNSSPAIRLRGAFANNLKNIDVVFPINMLTVVTGVSGSGKSSLVIDTLYPALKRHIDGYGEIPKIEALEGDLHLIEAVEMVSQSPIGKSSRSNPVTYIKAYDEIRKLFAQQPTAIVNGFKPSHFSFNVDGGRCEECMGEGEIKVEMQFMADVVLVCEACNGKRFKDEILEVKYKGKSIHDVLEMSVNEAISFFSDTKNGKEEKKIVEKLKVLQDVGLGYVKLGQSSSTLSGGESQRIKLASFLTKENDRKHTVFIFDEPTTGLHFHDIHKLMDSLNALLRRNNTVIIVEHNPEIIKNADFIIDLGPEGGKEGGNLVFEGTPENLVKIKNSYTAKFIEKHLY